MEWELCSSSAPRITRSEWETREKSKATVHTEIEKLIEPLKFQLSCAVKDGSVQTWLVTSLIEALKALENLQNGFAPDTQKYAPEFFKEEPHAVT